MKRLSRYLLGLVLIAPQWLAGEEHRDLHVLMMVGEREYETKQTLPEFAQRELEPQGIKVTTVNHDPANPNHFPGLEALSTADVLLLSVRRRTLSEAQMKLIREHFEAGKGLVAIRTASHAFSLRNKPSPEGCVQWQDFDEEVLGHDYQGHYSNKEGTQVHVEDRDSVLLDGVKEAAFRSGGTLYLARELNPDTTVLMTGVCHDKGKEVSEPVAFSRSWKENRIFYTSLGHPKDFENPSFRRLLKNAVVWAGGEVESVSEE